jgi:2-oxoglutarate dehydrogenase E2 component (dihydrolipoamide succinyltransferase)
LLSGEKKIKMLRKERREVNLYSDIHGSCKALKDFPGLNISVDGDYIIKKKNINLGMAASLLTVI